MDISEGIWCKVGSLKVAAAAGWVAHYADPSLTVVGIPVLKAFSDCVDQNLYSNCRTLRLFRQQQSSGSIVPLTPLSLNKPAVFFTANHSTGRSALEITADIYAKRASLPQVGKVRFLLVARTAKSAQYCKVCSGEYRQRLGSVHGSAP